MSRGGERREGQRAGSRVRRAQTPRDIHSHKAVVPQLCPEGLPHHLGCASSGSSCGAVGTLTGTPLGATLPVFILGPLAGRSPEEGPQAGALPPLRATPACDAAAAPRRPGLPLPIHCRTQPRMEARGWGRGACRSHGDARAGSQERKEVDTREGKAELSLIQDKKSASCALAPRIPPPPPHPWGLVPGPSSSPQPAK